LIGITDVKEVDMDLKTSLLDREHLQELPEAIVTRLAGDNDVAHREALLQQYPDRMEKLVLPSFPKDEASFNRKTKRRDLETDMVTQLTQHQGSSEHSTLNPFHDHYFVAVNVRIEEDGEEGQDVSAEVMDQFAQGLLRPQIPDPYTVTLCFDLSDRVNAKIVSSTILGYSQQHSHTPTLSRLNGGLKKKAKSGTNS
jgi:hypothetical protein